jgi:hypothetical protein
MSDVLAVTTTVLNVKLIGTVGDAPASAVVDCLFGKIHGDSDG